MFVGHLAVALAAKKVEPRLPLPWLTAAAFGLDMLWPALILTGAESVRIVPGITRFTPFDFVSYPWSHSLVMSVVWGAAAAVAAGWSRKSRRVGWIVAAVVVSHWVLDWITHRPDLPLWPGGPRVGLGLWDSVPGTIAVEGALYAIGIVIYLRATAARDAIGHWAFWALIIVTSVAWLSGPYSPPPPSVTVLVTLSIILIAVFLPWAAWIDRHRQSRSD